MLGRFAPHARDGRLFRRPRCEAREAHRQRDLDELSDRFDRGFREGELLGFVLHRVARGQPLPDRMLVAERAA